MDHDPQNDRHPGGADEHGDDVALLEDHTRKIAGGRSGRRIGVSMPGAIAGAFLVTALAFGAAIRPDGAALGDAGSQAGTVAVAGADVGGDGTLGYDGTPADWVRDGEHFGGDAEPGADPIKDERPDGDVDQPGDEPDGEQPADEPKDEPKDEPTDQPTDQPKSEALDLALKLDGAKVVVDWTACDPDGFRYYKVVRSTNEAVTWPLGIGDSLVGAVEDMGKTLLVDANAPAGKKVWYRVFALAGRDGKLVVACQSTIKSITTKPATEPVGDLIALELGIVEGHPKVAWGECGVDFDYYKVVRSTDSTATWPIGANDTVVGVVGPDGTRKVYDGDAPAGMKLWYRVFCVRSSGEGYVVVGKSATKAIETPAGEPKPEPSVLDIGIVQTPDGVVIEWQACDSDAFAYYKVVRSMTNTNPNYPLNDGTQVIAVFEDHAKTRFVDTNVEPGQTWYYRVVSMGLWGDQTVTLGYTPVASLTVE